MTLLGRWVACLLLLAFGASGQTGATPPPGHPEVFLAFLRYNEFLSQEISAMKSTDATAAKAMRNAAAERVGLTVDEFDVLLGAYAELRGQLDQIDGSVLSYIQRQRVSNELVDISKLESFRQDRVQAIEDSRANLRLKLDDGKWQTLEANIDEHRQYMKRRRTQ